MELISNFFERIMQIIDYKGYKSINSFAIDGLKYASSEKIYRLKNQKNKPSIDILADIANQFEEININWLITGKGEMILPNVVSVDKRLQSILELSTEDQQQILNTIDALIMHSKSKK